MGDSDYDKYLQYFVHNNINCKFRHYRVIRPSCTGLRIPGVYVLMLDGVIKYVGESQNIFDRLKQHKGKHYNHFTYVQIKDPQDRLDFESYCINTYNPELNGNRVDNIEFTDISRSQLNKIFKAKPLEEELNAGKGLANIYKFNSHLTTLLEVRSNLKTFNLYISHMIDKKNLAETTIERHLWSEEIRRMQRLSYKLDNSLLKSETFWKNIKKSMLKTGYAI